MDRRGLRWATAVGRALERDVLVSHVYSALCMRVGGRTCSRSAVVAFGLKFCLADQRVGEKEKNVIWTGGPHCFVYNRPTADGGWANMLTCWTPHTSVHCVSWSLREFRFPCDCARLAWSFSQLDVFIGLRVSHGDLSLLWCLILPGLHYLKLKIVLCVCEILYLTKMSILTVV